MASNFWKPATVRVALVGGVVAVVVAIIGLFANRSKPSDSPSRQSAQPGNSITTSGSNNSLSGVSGSSNAQGVVNQSGVVNQQQSFGASSPNIIATNVSIFNGPVTIVQVATWEEIKSFGVTVQDPEIAPLKWHVLDQAGAHPTREAVARIGDRRMMVVPITEPGGTRLTDNIVRVAG